MLDSDKERIGKERSEFLRKVNNAATLEELHELIRKSTLPISTIVSNSAIPEILDYRLLEEDNGLSEIDRKLFGYRQDTFGIIRKFRQLGNEELEKMKMNRSIENAVTLVGDKSLFFTKLKSPNLLENVHRQELEKILQESHNKFFTTAVLQNAEEQVQVEEDPNFPGISHIWDKDLHITIAGTAEKQYFQIGKADNLNFLKGMVTWPGVGDIADVRFQAANETVDFDQSDVIDKLNENTPRLKKADAKHGGLCDIICNYVVMNDVLSETSISTDAGTPQLTGEEIGKRLRGEIPPPSQQENPFNKLNNESVINELEKKAAPLHILKQVSYFQLLKAALFNVLPNNIVSRKEQKELLDTNSKDQEQLKTSISKAIEKIKPGQYIKFMAYDKNGLAFSGHSMLIKKHENGKYTFFDPNYGATVFNNKKELTDHLCEKSKEYSGTFGFKNICFINVEKMLPKKKAEAKATFKL